MKNIENVLDDYNDLLNNVMNLFSIQEKNKLASSEFNITSYKGTKIKILNSHSNYYILNNENKISLSFSVEKARLYYNFLIVQVGYYSFYFFHLPDIEKNSDFEKLIFELSI